MPKQDRKPRTGCNPAGPLKHPTRRRILRHLHRCDEPQGPSELATALGETVPQISYHLTALKIYGTTREAGPAPGQDALLHESAVREDDGILALLDDTAEDDESQAREAA
jgi:Helix-turn-helix domain